MAGETIGDRLPGDPVTGHDLEVRIPLLLSLDLESMQHAVVVELLLQRGHPSHMEVLGVVHRAVERREPL